MRDIIPKKYTPLKIEPVIELAKSNPKRLVKDSEEYYNKQVMNAAKTIAANKNIRFVLLCGPSASGKTTTAHKLKHRLISQGVGARVLSMDDFFLGVTHYPKLPDGSPDMESFLAIDNELLNKCFAQLMEEGHSLFPEFDFVKQERSPRTHKISLGENDVLIMEGIHALNPQILSNISREKVFRIYVSVRSKFMSEKKTILVPKDIRLIRRMVRDNNFRNHSPLKTLLAWENVLAAERVNINPYRDEVDLKIDNTIDYEVCIWHSLLKNLLEMTEEGTYGEYPAIERIFNGLACFPDLSHEFIPKNSLLREFVGDNI